MKICINNYSDPAINLQCSRFEVNNWVVSEFILKKLVPIVGIRPYPLNELMLMTSAVCRVKPTHIFEWGTHLGISARIFYEIIKNFHIPCEINSVDLPDDVKHPEHPGRLRGKFVKNISGVNLYQGDGLETSLNLYKNNRPKKSRPLFFLDGDHEYYSVKRELATIITAIPHASILVHDTFFQSGPSKYNTGPHRAVTAILRKVPHKFEVIQTATGLPGMTLLYFRP